VLIVSDTKKTGPEIVFPVRFFLLKICRAFWNGNKIGVPGFCSAGFFTVFPCVENTGKPEFSKMY